MARQLHLLPHDNLDEPRDWRLDDHTRTLGLQGLAQARAALRDARSASRPPARPTARTTRTAAAVRRSAA
ncbi:MAG TPA: hypothetical protein VGO78_29470 [Acidimicrobiales bacterium]|jgi:hypothetical protein|nr:hypothetical protein [Acidimicrobiales bacterium]